MPKRKPREVSAFEKLLVEVIDKASPGRVIISKTKPFFEGHEAGYEFEIKTRASTICILGQDLEDSMHVALDDLTNGEADPVRPTWNRVSRFHREVVIRTLQGIVAKHMARAAKARLGAKYGAGGEYAISDAFDAALEQLWAADDYNEEGALLPGTPKLEAEGPPEPIHVAQPSKRRSVRA